MSLKKLPRYIRHFFVKGNWLGTVELYDVQVHEELHPPGSEAYFCPTCGDVWARFPVIDKMTNKTIKYLARAVHCEKDGGTGELYAPWNPDFTSSLPNDAVRYEFNQLIKHYKEEE